VANSEFSSVTKGRNVASPEASHYTAVLGVSSRRGRVIDRAQEPPADAAGGPDRPQACSLQL